MLKRIKNSADKILRRICFFLDRGEFLGFYADPSFLYGHTKKFAKAEKDKNFKMNIGEGFKRLNKLPITIFYSKIGKEQIIANLQEDFNLGEIDSENIFLKSIKDYRIKYLPIPSRFDYLKGKMYKDFKKVEKMGKGEDCLHICMASENKLPAITGEVREKFELWKQYYPPTISRNKFWSYIEELNNTKGIMDKNKAELILKSFLQ